MMLLEVKNVNTYYGISHILFDVSMEIKEGEVICLLGRNGVGKTTTLRSIMGLTPLRNGSIVFQDREIGKKEWDAVDDYPARAGTNWGYNSCGERSALQ